MKRLIKIFVIIVIVYALSNLNYGVNASSVEDVDVMKSYDNLLEESLNYPDFDDGYGGVYIDDNGILVLNIVEGKVEKFLENVEVDTNIAIKEVQYSLKDIIQAQEELRKIAKDLCITSIARSERDNTLIVTINNDFEYNKSWLLESIKLDNIIVIEDYNEMTIKNTVNYVINGTETVINSSGLTVGFAARRNGDAGFVTAGHVVSSNGDNVYCGVSHCGDVDGRINSGSVDATFVDLRYPLIGTKWLPTKEFMNDDTYYSVNTSDYFLIQGVGVSAYGFISGKKNGTIMSTSFDYEDEDGHFRYDFVQSSYYAIFGDSGAGVTMPGYWGGSTFHIKVIGIQSGTLVDENNNWIPGVSFTVFCETGNIFSHLGLTGY